jgi:hypothetical protein
MKRLGTLLVFLILVAGFGFFGRELLWEVKYQNRPAEALPAATPALPPCHGCNLILVSMDTLRADFAEQAPNLKLIAADGIEFTKAYTNAFYTTPSHMTVFTGLYPNRHRVEGRGINLPRAMSTPLDSGALDPRHKTLTEVLASAGYQTTWFASQHLKHLDPALGFGRGFKKFEPTPFARPGRPGGLFNHAALERALASKGKFFYFLHSYVTHAPYLLPDPETAFPMLFGLHDMIQNYFQVTDRWQNLPKACASLGNINSCLSNVQNADIFLHDMGSYQLRVLDAALLGRHNQKFNQQKAALHQAYGRSVAALDSQLGTFWQEFKSSGHDRDTIVVLFSDHGEELYEHGHGSHSSFFEHTAHVPLIVYHPKLKGPVRVNELVSLVDIWPTLAATLGLHPPEPLQGRDLAMHTTRPVFGFALGRDYVTDGEWKLLRGTRGIDELYHLATDPNESTELSEYRWPRIQAARERLVNERKRWEMEQSL